jgi:hypothetical protein
MSVRLILVRLAAALTGAPALSCSAPPPDPGPLPSTPVAIADTSALRARVSACLGLSAEMAVSWLGPPLVKGAGVAARACVERTLDCDGVLSCVGLARGECTTHCAGSQALACNVLDNQVATMGSEDCADNLDGNLLCGVVESAGAHAQCVAGPCRGERCEGAVRVACRGGFEIREDCARSGKQCVDGAGTRAFCGSSTPCERDHCAGNTSVTCHDGRAAIEQDCAELVASGRCHGNGECRSDLPHPACATGMPFFSFCEGNAARACYLGALYEVACDEFLGGSCVPREQGDGVRCRLPVWP